MCKITSTFNGLVWVVNIKKKKNNGSRGWPKHSTSHVSFVWKAYKDANLIRYYENTIESLLFRDKGFYAF